MPQSQKIILVVDDEKDIRDLISFNLRNAGFAVTEAADGPDALVAAHQHPDCILLDIMLPGIDGFEVARRLKRNPETAALPILFLTARSADTDEVQGLEIGAEDYLVKPVRIPSLLARLKATLRRSAARQSDQREITFAGVVIETNNYRVRVDGKAVSMARKEFDLLVYLAQHPETVLGRERLLSAVWGDDVMVVDRTVDVHISRIREKIAPYGDHIETVKGVGYRIRMNDE
jgi:two-component system alkaline phosphatase synthesis response regulator PhoP